MTGYRVEHDSMGEVNVPADRYWGAQTERSRMHFPIGVGIETMPQEIIHAFGILKKAAALANHRLCPEKMTDEKLDLIIRACNEVIRGELAEQFPLGFRNPVQHERQRGRRQPGQCAGRRKDGYAPRSSRMQAHSSSER